MGRGSEVRIQAQKERQNFQGLQSLFIYFLKMDNDVQQITIVFLIQWIYLIE